MAREAALPRRRRRPRRERALAAAPTTGAAAPEAAPSTEAPDDTRTVYAWLTRLTVDPADTERLLVEILRRSRAARPGWLRTASGTTWLQFLTVQSVLRQRGVL